VTHQQLNSAVVGSVGVGTPAIWQCTWIARAWSMSHVTRWRAASLQ